MRRPGPRPAAGAIRGALDAAAPRTPLAELQRAWPGAVGERIAREARPVSERGGTVVVQCSSAAWAQELELLSPDLLARLADAVPEAALPRRMRFVAGGRPRSP